MSSARVPVVLFIRLHKLALHSSLTCKLNSLFIPLQLREIYPGRKSDDIHVVQTRPS